MQRSTHISVDEAEQRATARGIIIGASLSSMFWAILAAVICAIEVIR